MHTETLYQSLMLLQLHNRNQFKHITDNFIGKIRLIEVFVCHGAGIAGVNLIAFETKRTSSRRESGTKDVSHA